MTTENALFTCLNCEADLGATGQQHLENTEDGGQIWNCEPAARGSSRMESFDEAHKGRCLACSVFDNGTHMTHRYGIFQEHCSYSNDAVFFKDAKGKRLEGDSLESKRRAGFAFMRRELGLKEKVA